MRFFAALSLLTVALAAKAPIDGPDVMPPSNRTVGLANDIAGGFGAVNNLLIRDSSLGSCRDGEQECGINGCCDSSGECCGLSNCCESGQFCIDKSLGYCCKNGQKACGSSDCYTEDNGETCCDDEGLGGHCKKGQSCCGTLGCCEEGYHCEDDDQCHKGSMGVMVKGMGVGSMVLMMGAWAAWSELL